MIDFNEHGISMSSDQIKAAMRINECVADGQGHDVPPELMEQLSELGLVLNKGDDVYEQTDLMISVLQRFDDVAITVFGNARPTNLFGVEYEGKFTGTKMVKTGAGRTQG